MIRTSRIRIGKLEAGGGKGFLLIAGPCVIESEESALRHARAVKRIARQAGVAFVFKASFDKANRTSLKSFRGPGLEEGLRILARVRKEVGVPVLSDIHLPEQAKKAGEVLDAIQIPALLSRQTDLLVEAARTGKAVNIKKGQFMDPRDMRHACEKIQQTGNRNILVTERGSTFGYRNLVSDFRSLVVMRRMGYPVAFDATHSVQQPGSADGASGGDWEFAPALARAAVAVGCDALFMEVHENPSKAKSDGPVMIPLKRLGRLLSGWKRIEKAVNRVD